MARSARKDSDDASPRNLGRYRLYGELAAGGMATVHLGRQLGSGGFSKMVAIKRLHPQFGKIEEFVEMFLAEARLAARIRHPNVVQPLDVLRVEDEVFLVMEYVEGDSLSRLMKATVARQEKVPLPVAIAIVSGMLRGLHAAHEAKNDKGEPLGLIHRDVSPQNVLVAVDGTARVIDFGIAKAADSVQVTREGELKGKLAYIAPEILNGHRGTRRADIYAAAVVLWEVLTAQRLFDADYQSAVLANILHRPVDPPSDFVPGLPTAIDRVVMKGLARDPSDRYATAREMAVALEEAVSPAGPATVGEWVETIAAISLANRGRRVAQIEASSSDEGSTDEPEEVLSEFVTIASDDGEPPAPPPPVRPAAGVPPSSSRFRATGNAPPSMRPPSVSPASIAPGAPPPSFAPAPPPPPRRPTSPGRESAPPPPSLQHAPTLLASEIENVQPAWPVPGIAPAPTGATVILGPKHRSSGGGIVVFILALALVAALLYVGLPEYVRRTVVAAAARQGVTLAVDSVDVAFRRARLVGVSATAADLPGFSLQVRSAEVWFSFNLEPTDVAAHDVTLSLDGSVAAVEETMRRAALAHDLRPIRSGTVRQVAVDAGHVAWTRPFGEGTRFEAQNIDVEAERTGHDGLGEDLTFASPIVGVTAAWGKLGPWAANGQVDHGRLKATVALDPSGASKASAVAAIDQGHVASFDVTLPRSNVALLGVGAAVLGRRPDEPLFVEGEAHYAAKPPARVEAGVRLSLSGARLTNAATGADALFEAHADGDPARPVDVTRGAMAFGPFRGPVGGQVTFADTFLRVDLGLRSAPTHCPTGPDVSLGGGVVFDTRALGDAQLVVAPSGRCALKVLPP